MLKTLQPLLRLLLPAVFLFLFSFSLSAQQVCTLDAGELNTPTGSVYIPVCLDDMDEGLTEITRTGFVGGISQYVVTTPSGFILEILDGNPPFDLRSYGATNLAVWSISYSGTLTDFNINDNICATGATECFNLSNPVVLNRQEGDGCDIFCESNAGNITLPDGSSTISQCVGDSGNINLIDVVLDGTATGDNLAFAITNDQGTIIDLPTGNGPFNFMNFGPGTFLIWYVSFADDATGIAIGNGADDIEGCFSISNPVTVIREQVNAGNLAIEGGGTELTICAGDGNSDVFNVSLTDTIGSGFTYVITDGMGVVLGTPANQPFDLEGAGGGACNIYALSFGSNFGGVSDGDNIADFTGCFALSNPITVTRLTGDDCGDTEFIATLSGLNEMPCPVTTTGQGSLSASLVGNTLTVMGEFSGLTSDFDPNVAGGAHLHNGLAGQNGGIAVRLTTDLDADLRGGRFLASDNVFDLTDEQVTTLRERGLYVNIHTLSFGGGELRGQIVPAGADDYKVAYLLGVNEVPAVITTAGGSVVVEREGNTITLSGSFSGLSGPIATQILGGAHLHLGIAGRNGPVQFPLNMEISADMTAATFEADSNVYVLTDEQLAALDDEMFYVNVHSSEVLSGELRGQLTDMSVSQFYSNPSGHQARPISVNTAGNGRLVINWDGAETITVSGSVNNLTSPLDTNIAGGSHIHLGLPGRSGGIAFRLNVTLDDDGTGGVWLPAENTFTLSPDELNIFFDRGYYVNVHSTDFPSGEVRGQVMFLAKGYFGANMAGINANPSAVKSTGNGFFMFDWCGDRVTGLGSFNDLSSDFDADIAGGIHIHTGDAASTGGIVFPLNGEVDPGLRAGFYLSVNNEFTIDSASRADLVNGNLYVNIHTEDNPSGEIRGQILRDDDAFPTAPEIIAPADGATVTVFEGGNDLEDGLFSSADDPNGDLLVYTIEITGTLDPEFEEIVACQKVGTDTISTASFEAIYDTLISFGLVPGFSVDLLYRVVASDGSVATPGGSRSITLVLGENPCNSIEGGNLALAAGGTEFTICAGDGTPDPFSVILTDTVGAEFTYLVVSDAGEILGVPANQPFNFDGAGGGACTLYAVSHDGTLTGATVGASFDDLGGCFDLSNPIVVTRLTGEDCQSSEFTATLSGLNEMPCPVTTSGIGSLSATLTGNTLTVSGEFSGLASDFDANVAGGAHLHTGMAGQNGGIAFRLASELDTDLRSGRFLAADNVFELTNDQVSTLRARGLYVNIHTLDFGSGELRSQLVPDGADDYKVAYLLGVNEVPSVVTPAGGAVVIERNGSAITLSGSFSGLTGTIATQIAGGAHIHMGIAGRNGPVLFPLNLEISDDMTAATFMADSNIYVLDDDQLAAIDNDMFYVNIHSSAVMSGELRGQVTDMGVSQFYSNPSGHQARPVAINTPGNARLLINLIGDSTITVSGSVGDLLDTVSTAIAGGAHIHLGLPGRSGGIVFPLNISTDENGQGGSWLPADNTFRLDSSEYEALFSRGLYVNIHSGFSQSGEIRGQVMNLAKGYFGSNLAGINANPEAVKTTGGGFIMYELCGEDFVATGSFADLDSDFDANIAGGSHVHLGDADGTGGIQLLLNAELEADNRAGFYSAENNQFNLDSAGRANLLAGNFYFNLHTTDNPSGEIRGQILRDDDAFPESAEIITPEDGATVIVFDGGNSLEDGVFASAADPDGDLVVYTIEITGTLDPEFEEIVACQKVGTDTLSLASIQAVYDTLISFGLQPGFSIDLLYRVVASDGSVSIPGSTREITLELGTDPCAGLAGGTLALAGGGTELTICAGDGIPDPFNVTLTGNSGTEFTYIVVSDQGEILGVPASQPFDFDGAGGGACTLYGVSHNGALTGAITGAAFADLGGCFELSNPIVVTRNVGTDCESCNVAGGILGLAGDGGTELTICAGDGIDDDFNVTLTDTTGSGFTYVITNGVGVVLSTPADQPFNLEGAGGGNCIVYALSSGDGFGGVAMGDTLANLTGCFELSNGITVTRQTGDDCETGLVGINEINQAGMVELINLSNISVNAGNLFLLSNGQVALVSTLTVECGSLFLKPGDLVTIDASSLLDNAGDELALSITEVPASTRMLISYVAWGTSDRSMEDMAITAGIWLRGTELDAPSDIVSIQRIPTLSFPTYALGGPTPCAVNTLTTSINQPAADRIQVYPNPVGDLLTVELTGLRAFETKLQLLDINGRVVNTRSLQMINGRMDINTSDLPAGTYLLRLTNEAGISTARIIRR